MANVGIRIKQFVAKRQPFAEVLFTEEELRPGHAQNNAVLTFRSNGHIVEGRMLQPDGTT